jgi:hypothetical protein
MKHLKISMIALIILTFNFSSCKKDKINSTDIIQVGNRKVNLYNDSRTDDGREKLFLYFGATFPIDKGNIDWDIADNTSKDSKEGC